LPMQTNQSAAAFPWAVIGSPACTAQPF